MNTYVRTPLRIASHKKIYYNQRYLTKYKRRLLELLDENDYMDTLEFAKDAMELQEIKANNNIEGINDDLSVIEKTIRNQNNIPLSQKERIINLHKGYHYILTHSTINKESLRELYAILSKGLLDNYSIENTGEYYRQRPVYILKNCKFDIELYKGIPENELEKYMDRFFEFVNTYEAKGNMNNFLKSQIMHFYFVYVHPYFDVNGRTSRTVAMWHLLNEKSYPYIIFNRAISFNKGQYEKYIINGRKHGDITLFLKYMLKEVEKELEKQIIIHDIKKNLDEELTREECQLIEYFLSLKSEITLFDLTTKYNAFNVYQSPCELVKNQIYPLIEKNVFLNLGPTKHKLTTTMPNLKLAISSDLIDIDPQKIKSLSLKNYIK